MREALRRATKAANESQRRAARGFWSLLSQAVLGEVVGGAPDGEHSEGEGLMASASSASMLCSCLGSGFVDCYARWRLWRRIASQSYR